MSWPSTCFRNEIDDYIERIQVAPGLRSFRNLTEGRLEGIEVDALYRISSAWRFSFQGHRLRGRDGDGQPLADVPPHRISFGLSGHRGGWGWNGSWQIRWPKDDPAGGEIPIRGGHLVALSLDREIVDGLVLQARVNNLLAESLLLSADDLATPVRGRSWGLHLAWRG